MDIDFPPPRPRHLLTGDTIASNPFGLRREAEPQAPSFFLEQSHVWGGKYTNTASKRNRPCQVALFVVKNGGTISRH
jgi:hypothetical protein